MTVKSMDSNANLTHAPFLYGHGKKDHAITSSVVEWIDQRLYFGMVVL